MGTIPSTVRALVHGIFHREVPFSFFSSPPPKKKKKMGEMLELLKVASFSEKKIFPRSSDNMPDGSCPAELFFLIRPLQFGSPPPPPTQTRPDAAPMHTASLRGARRNPVSAPTPFMYIQVCAVNIFSARQRPYVLRHKSTKKSPRATSLRTLFLLPYIRLAVERIGGQQSVGDRGEAIAAMYETPGWDAPADCGNESWTERELDGARARPTSLSLGSRFCSLYKHWAGTPNRQRQNHPDASPDALVGAT